ncbi:MAG: DUF1559 domain-containing protein [Planctomycetia bacterium]
MARRSRSAVTLIELLVVIAIVGIVASLLLPAILQSRSAGRKAQCAANLKQLAQATQSFHDRMNCLPVYWGAMKGGGGEVFGGWLLHLLPDLDQQAAYDRVVPYGTLAVAPNLVISSTSWQDTVSYVPTGRMLPARPPSDDYRPEQISTGTARDLAGNNIVYPVVIPQVGDPGEPARPEYVATVTGSQMIVTTSTNVSSNWGGLSTNHDTVTGGLSLPALLDPEDGSPMRAPSRPPTPPSGYEDSPLSNYQANAHVLTKFNGGRYVLNAAGTSITLGASGPVWVNNPTAAQMEFAGYFPQPLQAGPGGTITSTGWNHTLSESSGPVGGRRFDHVTDGISNTLLFAEAMRQCDAGQGLRYAFLPSGPGGANVTPTWFNEHAFGILPSLRQVVTSTGGAVISGTSRAPVEAFGHTLMFQTQPLQTSCNPARVQALHGNFLMTAMCDGSVRAISSLVSRREPVGAAACGRARFGTNRGDYQSRGGQLPRTDGVWDMLMVPSDPPENVLSNTGEIGRERGPTDPPL